MATIPYIKKPAAEKQQTLQKLCDLLNENKPMTRADRDAICLAVEALCRRVIALEKAHNANDGEMRETHILARQVDTKLDNVRAEMATLRKRLEMWDSE